MNCIKQRSSDARKRNVTYYSNPPSFNMNSMLDSS